MRMQAKKSIDRIVSPENLYNGPHPLSIDVYRLLSEIAARARASEEAIAQGVEGSSETDHD